MESVVFVLPVVYFDILVGLWVIHEPHQLQVEDRWEGEKLDSFLCFLQHKRNHSIYIGALNLSMYDSQIFT